MELGADQHLVHAGACCDSLQVRHPALSPGHAVLDPGRAQRVQAVGVYPEVRVRYADAADPRVVEPADALVGATSRQVDEADAASSHALPAGITDLAAQRERRLEGVARFVDSMLGQ